MGFELFHRLLKEVIWAKCYKQLTTSRISDNIDYSMRLRRNIRPQNSITYSKGTLLSQLENLAIHHFLWKKHGVHHVCQEKYLDVQLWS